MMDQFEQFSAEDDQIRKWAVSIVDDAVPDDSTTELIKMSTCELSQDEMEGIQQPSDIYNALQKHYKQPSKALARFIYSLELLQRERVDDTISDECLQKHGIQKPSPCFDPTIMSCIFQLHQTLVRVCVALHDSRYTEDRQSIINYCSHMSGMTAKKCKTLPILFRKLIQKGRITEEDQMVLAEGLIAVHAKECFEMIQDFRKKNCLVPINLEEVQQRVNEKLESKVYQRVLQCKPIACMLIT